MKKEGKPLMHGASAVCSFFEEFTKIFNLSLVLTGIFLYNLL